MGDYTRVPPPPVPPLVQSLLRSAVSHPLRALAQPPLSNLTLLNSPIAHAMQISPDSKFGCVLSSDSAQKEGLQLLQVEYESRPLDQSADVRLQVQLGSTTAVFVPKLLHSLQAFWSIPPRINLSSLEVCGRVGVGIFVGVAVWVGVGRRQARVARVGLDLVRGGAGAGWGVGVDARWCRRGGAWRAHASFIFGGQTAWRSRAGLCVGWCCAGRRGCEECGLGMGAGVAGGCPPQLWCTRQATCTSLSCFAERLTHRFGFYSIRPLLGGAGDGRKWLASIV